MKYALVKFRVHLLGSRPFVIYTDHASLRTATNSPRQSQRMTRWLSFFEEYNFRVEYKLGKLNVLADALPRRPDHELAHITRVTTDLYDRIRMVYRNDESLASLVRFLVADKEAKSEWLSPRQRSRIHRYEWQDGLRYYQVEPHEPPRVVVPNDEDLKFDILQQAYDAPSSDHLGRKKTFLSVSQAFWWTHMYKWVARYVKTCETCQRVKPAGHASASLQSLPVPTDCWKSMSLVFVFGLPADDHRNTSILVFVCRLSKMVHLAPVPDTVTGEHAARLFVDGVFRHHGLPETFVSDRDSRFTAAFWQTLFQLPVSLRKKVEYFIDTRLNVINRVLLLDTRNLPLDTVSSVGSNKLKHRFIRPFAVLARQGASYTIDLPKSMKTHPIFYVGRMKRYHDPQGPAAPKTPQVSREVEDPTPRNENQPQTSSKRPAA
ncbi:hypothetical protein PC123_g15765 [Phytophthora cactorum]|nr:hypothetical protein PC123_g15765 [Phytophthora cactorum]